MGMKFNINPLHESPLCDTSYGNKTVQATHSQMVKVYRLSDIKSKGTENKISCKKKKKVIEVEKGVALATFKRKKRTNIAKKQILGEQYSRNITIERCEE